MPPAVKPRHNSGQASVNFFGGQVTLAWLMMHTVAHAHEHLGQSIAYARMNGVVPPWSTP